MDESTFFHANEENVPQHGINVLDSLSQKISWEEMANEQKKQKTLLTHFLEELIQRPSETLEVSKPNEAKPKDSEAS